MNRVPLNKLSASVLLVEDNVVNQKVACRLLERTGIRVTIAENGQEALEKLARETFDLVLMDIQMPVMDGITATREIRSQERFRNLPIIALSANSQEEDRKRCLAAGMNTYISKPIDALQLYEVLSQYLALAQVKAQAQASPQPAAMVLPPLDCIDSAAGIRRMGDDASLYLDILFKFFDRQQDFVAQMKSLLAADDSRIEARRQAHTLKGLAGSIGAGELQQRSLALETCLATNSTACLDLLGPLEAELQAVFAAIASIARLRPASSSAATLDQEELATLLSESQDLLTRYDAEAEGPVEKLCAGLMGGPWAEQAVRVRELTRRYDYEAALAELQGLALAMQDPV